jgi:hypothetical protein
MDIVVILLLAWLPLGIIAGPIVGRVLAYGNQPLPAPTPAPDRALPPFSGFACVSYQCATCERRVHEHVTDVTRLLAITGQWTCPQCVDTLARLEQDVTR